MIEAEDNIRDIQAYWNQRASLAPWAGSRDVLAKQLEIEAIAGYVRDGMHILDIGCGNGLTAIELAKRFHVDVMGFDYAEEMVSAANKLAVGQKLCGSVTFRIGDVRKLEEISDRFDLIYTERVIINLPSWELQKKAIADICNLLAPNGLFVMCENSQDGLDKINSFRNSVGLTSIVPPWHNRYLRDVEVAQISIPGIRLDGVNCYSSTYYFLSRIVNAWLAAQDGKEPDYDAPVNHLALKLPPIGDMGQGKIWLWRRASQDRR